MISLSVAIDNKTLYRLLSGLENLIKRRAHNQKKNIQKNIRIIEKQESRKTEGTMLKKQIE